MPDDADRRPPPVRLTGPPAEDSCRTGPGAGAFTAPEVTPPPGEGELYRLLFEHYPVPVWVIDEETSRFVAVNTAVTRTYGYTRDELLGRAVADVSTGGELEPPAGRTPPGVTTPAPGLLWRHRTRSGQVLRTEVLTSRFRAGGRRLRLVVATDQAERRRTEGELREREVFLHSLLAHIPCGVFWKDRASVYLGCNEQVARDHGLAVPGEVIGRSDYELTAVPEEAAGARDRDRQVIETGGALLNVEETRTTLSGVRAALLTSRVPLRDATGRAVGVLGVYQDITDRKRLEEQFRQAQKMEAVGRLAGGIAHDFNNLLTIILGNVSIVRDLPPGHADSPQLIRDIHDAADRAAVLTRQLLTFSRKQPSRPEVLDVGEVVTGLAGLLRRLLGERIRTRTDPGPSPLRVRMDRGQLEQVVMNLAVNARDAMPDGGDLTVAVAPAEAPPRDGPAGATPARFAELSVSDTGCGMTEEVLSRIFEPFFTTKEVGKGTGLGLATVYGIADRAGGHVKVESAPGAGTTFRVLLPRWESGPPPSSVIRPPGPAGEESGAGRSVLLVEDEEGIRKLARYTLEGRGYRVTEADGSEGVLDRLDPGLKFDLLVSDLVMPGLDGRELAARVRARQPDVAIVFISGYARDDAPLDDFPGALFLAKPFTPTDLARVAGRAVRRRPGRS